MRAKRQGRSSSGSKLNPVGFERSRPVRFFYPLGKVTPVLEELDDDPGQPHRDCRVDDRYAQQQPMPFFIGVGSDDDPDEVTDQCAHRHAGGKQDGRLLRRNRSLRIQ